MLDLQDIKNTSIPIEEREQFLLDALNRLDKDCYSLFCAVVDLDGSQMDKVNQLVNWLHDLIKKYSEINQAFEYLSDQEYLNEAYAIGRLQMKKMLANVVSLNAMILDLTFGLLSLYVLRSIAKRDFEREKEIIDERRKLLDEDLLNRVECTLSNSDRLLAGKVSRSSDEIIRKLQIKNSL